MKKTGLILLISGFWLLAPGYYTNTHAQQETLTLLTYYPAPYGVYNRLQVGSDPANGILLEPSDVSPNAGYIRFGDNTGWRLHIGRYKESVPASPNTGTTGVLMTVQDNGNVGIGITNPTNKIHAVGRNDTTDNIVFMPGSDTAAAGIPNIKVGVGTNNPGSDKLDIVTTVNSLNDLDSDIPMLIRRSNNTNNTGTGIGFACTTGTGMVGAKIIHERKGINSQGDLVFYTKSDSNQTSLDERMRIDQDGDVTFRNMPGVAYKNYITKDWNPTAGTGFPTTAWNTSLNWRDVDSITIQIPAMGYILVQSSGNIGTYFQSNEAAVYYMSVGISGISNTGPISPGADASARMEVTGGGAAGPNQRFPYSCATVYPITDTDVTNGSKTFYIVATMTCTGNGSRRLIVNGSVQAMFFPVEYNS